MVLSELRMSPHLSASGIGEYVECSLLYRFGRIDKLPFEFRSDNLEFGTVIHRVLGEFYQERMTGDRMPLNDVHALFEENWRAVAELNDEIRYSNGKDFQTLLISGIDLLTAWYHKLPDDNFRVISVEEAFSFNIDDLPLPIIGATDLIEGDDSGTIIITDWKTSARAYGIDEVDRNQQLTCYGFVFLHPFEDGNGRIHRYLIHNILVRRGFTPEGIMFPISASMQKNPAAYNASLEAFSRQLMSMVEYSLDEDGRMTIHNETAIWYRYIDMTPQAEALFRFIDQTIDTELAGELAFLANYDKTKKAIQEIVDMPDRQIDLFIRFCLQNNGQLSGQKRASHFDFLLDEEIASLEQAVQSAYGSETLNNG